MKKVILSICAALCGLSMNAQLVSSHSTLREAAPKAPSRTTWMVRVGVGTNTMAGDEEWEDVGSKFGYFVGFEFNKTIRHRGAYWGMDFALASRGYKYSEKEDGESYEFSLNAHNFHWSPFIFGWKIGIPNSKFSIDPHIGVYLACDYAGKYKETYDYAYDDAYDFGEYGKDDDDDETKIGDAEDYNRFDAGMKIGVGCWYNNKFNFDLTYQRGFLTDDMDVDGGTSNFWIRLGYAF